MIIKAVIETLGLFLWIAQALLWETQALLQNKCFERRHQQLQWKHARLDLLTESHWVVSITPQHIEPHCATFAWRKMKGCTGNKNMQPNIVCLGNRLQQTATHCDTLSMRMAITHT